VPLRLPVPGDVGWAVIDYIRNGRPEVRCMTESPSCYDITVTVNRNGEHLPNPAEFAVAAEHAASARSASSMSAHTAEKIISIVTVQGKDRPAAVAIALAVVFEALRRPAA
jgi:hypothetical protein